MFIVKSLTHGSLRFLISSVILTSIFVVAFPMAPLLTMPKNFKHNFFFSDRVLVDPFVITSFSQNVESVVLVVDPPQVKVDLSNNKEGKNVQNELAFPRLMGCKVTLGRIYCGC